MRGRNETTTSSPRPSPPVEEREKTTAVHGPNARSSKVGALHEPLQFERCCGWSPTQPGSVEEQVHGHNACAKQKEAFHELANEHVAPTELGEGSRDIDSYRHVAP